MMFTGVRHVITIPVSFVHDYMKLKNGTIPKPSQMCEFIKTLSQVDLDAMAAMQIFFFHIVQKAGHVLWIPPGWFVMEMVKNSKAVTGARRSYAPALPFCIASMAVLVDPVRSFAASNPKKVSEGMKALVQIADAMIALARSENRERSPS